MVIKTIWVVRVVIVAIVVIGILGGCEEDILSPVARKPYPVVHCVLNWDDTAHYVSLTKTFSGPYGADVMAQNPDSLYFKSARVFFELWDETFIYETIELMPTTEIVKDTGMFFSGYQILYKTNKRVSTLRLRIEIPEINTEVIGYINPRGRPVFTEPKPSGQRILYFYEPEPVRIYWDGEKGVCETNIRLRYLDVTTGGVDTCRLDWIRKNDSLVLVPADYLTYLSYWIHDKPGLRYRVLMGIDILASTGDKAMADYFKFRDWGIDIIEKPYSNLINAYGFVGSRVYGGLTGCLPNEKFMDTLVNSRITQHLKFKKYTGGLPQNRSDFNDFFP